MRIFEFLVQLFFYCFAETHVELTHLEVEDLHIEYKDIEKLQLLCTRCPRKYWDFQLLVHLLYAFCTKMYTSKFVSV